MKFLSRHTFYALVSQFVNSLTNFALSIVVAKESTPAEYGAWAIVYATFVLCLQVIRALVGTVVLISRDFERDVPRWMASQAVSVTVLIGLISSTLLTVFGFLFLADQSLGPFAAIFLSSFLVHDTLRYLALRGQRGGIAAVLDCTWLTVFASAVVTLYYFDMALPTTLTLVWAASTVPGVVIRILIDKTWLTISGVRRFWNRNFRDGIKLLAETMLGNGLLQFLPLILAVTTGFIVAGGIRAGQTLFGPITLVIMGLTPIMTSAAVDRVSRRERHRIMLVPFAAFAAGIALTSAVAIALLPDYIGRQILGSNWAVATSILIPMTVAAIFRGVLAGVPILLRAEQRLTDAVRLQIGCAVPALIVPVGGAIVDGLPGAAWGIAIAAAVNTAQCLHRLGINRS